MTTPASSHEKGRALEERIGAVFEEHGYVVRRNASLSGRSGARHEIDVLAEREEALSSTRIMVECKAWNAPIEKDVVSKVHLVMQDLGMNQAIIVALDGWRVGAEVAAKERGIDLWGPEEIRNRLGALAVAGLRAGPSRREAEGRSPSVPWETATRFFGRQSKGVLGRVREEITHHGLLWQPHQLLQIACSREEGRFRAKTITRRTWNLYDAVTGGLARRFAAEPSRENVDIGDAVLPVQVSAKKIEKEIFQALGRLREVSTDAARNRHAARLVALGVELPVRGVVVEQSSLFYWPVWAAVLKRKGGERVLVLDAVTGESLERTASRLSAQASLIGAALGMSPRNLAEGD